MRSLRCAALQSTTAKHTNSVQRVTTLINTKLNALMSYVIGSAARPLDRK